MEDNFSKAEIKLHIKHRFKAQLLLIELKI